MVLQAGNLFHDISQDIFASLLWQTKRQWVFLSPKFLAFWSGNVFQDISLLAAVFNAMLRKTMDVFVTYMFCFLFLDISLLVWCGVQNQRVFFCFDFVFQDIFLLAVVFKTRKGVLLLCFVFQYISLSVWCGVQNQRRLFVITSRHLRRTPISAS